MMQVASIDLRIMYELLLVCILPCQGTSRTYTDVNLLAGLSALAVFCMMLCFTFDTMPSKRVLKM